MRLISLDDGSFPFPARYFFSNVAEAGWRRELATDSDGTPTADALGARAGYRQEDVTIVVNTHAHGDHASRSPCA